jgi:hypothetical protein
VNTPSGHGHKVVHIKSVSFLIKQNKKITGTPRHKDAVSVYRDSRPHDLTVLGQNAYVLEIWGFNGEFLPYPENGCKTTRYNPEIHNPK